MISETLRLHDNTTSIEIYLNDNGKIFIGEIDADDPQGAFCIVMSRDDWQTIKRFIDKQFKSLDTPF